MRKVSHIKTGLTLKPRVYWAIRVKGIRTWICLVNNQLADLYATREKVIEGMLSFGELCGLHNPQRNLHRKKKKQWNTERDHSRAVYRKHSLQMFPLLSTRIHQRPGFWEPESDFEPGPSWVSFKSNQSKAEALIFKEGLCTANIDLRWDVRALIYNVYEHPEKQMCTFIKLDRIHMIRKLKKIYNKNKKSN